MSARRTVRIKTEYRDEDLMTVVRHLMSERYTGPIVLHCSQGIVRSLVTETEQTDGAGKENGRNGISDFQKLLDASHLTD
jgi:hypothetical protein